MFSFSVCSFSNCEVKERQIDNKDAIEYGFYPIQKEEVTRFKEDLCEILWGEEMDHKTPELKTPSPSPDNK